MPPLTLSSLRLGLDDFFQRRAILLEGTSTGQMYVPLLQKYFNQILAIPARLLDDRSIQEQLADLNVHHDDLGRALFFQFESYQHLPGLPDKERNRLEQLRETIVPSLSHLQRKASEEADWAIQGMQKLAGMEADLKQYPLFGGKTLYDLTKEFFQTGPERQERLGARVDAGPSEADKEARRQMGKLLSTVTGILNRTAEALQDEMEINPSLPRDLPQKAFGFFDELRKSNAKPRPKPDQSAQSQAEISGN